MKFFLDLFSGSKSAKSPAIDNGLTYWSVDTLDSADETINILEWDYKKLHFVPDIIWASPPCTAFSIASVSTHWDFPTPKTEKALLGIALLEKTMEIINYYLKINPDMVYYVENPRGMMRKMNIMQPFPLTGFFRHTVTYCQYGHDSMKPTDIWTNNPAWDPRPPCKNGDPCHVRAPRGSRTGTQGKENAFERGKVPLELLNEVIGSVKR